MIPSEEYHGLTDQVIDNAEIREEDDTNGRTDASGRRRASQEQIVFVEELPTLVEERLDIENNSNSEEGMNETRVGTSVQKRRKSKVIRVSIEDEERQPSNERLQHVDNLGLAASTSPRIPQPSLDNETEDINIIVTPPPRITRLARYGSIGDSRLDGPPPRRQRISSE